MVGVGLFVVLLAFAPTHQFGPTMLNGGRPVLNEWRRGLVASSPAEAMVNRNEEVALFAHGRALRERKAKIMQRLAACGKDDRHCRSHVIEEAKEEEHVAENHQATKAVSVTDAMGRAMPLLFSQTEKSSSAVKSAAFFLLTAWYTAL